MLHLVTKPRTEAAFRPATPEAGEAGFTLLRLAGPLGGKHALVLGAHGPEWLCRMLRSGCAAVTSTSLGQRPEHEAFDLVFAPHAAPRHQLAALVRGSLRALVPGGRFLAWMDAAGALPGEEPGAPIVQRLRLDGFVGVTLERHPGGLSVRAVRPAVGYPRLMADAAAVRWRPAPAAALAS